MEPVYGRIASVVPAIGGLVVAQRDTFSAKSQTGTLIGNWRPFSFDRRWQTVHMPYTWAMRSEQDFQLAATAALVGLKRHLVEGEQEQHTPFELKQQENSLQVVFERGGGRLVVEPNQTVRQMWVSGRGASFQLDWDSRTEKFIWPKSGENLIPLVERLISENHPA
jgi:CyaY protein